MTPHDREWNEEPEHKIDAHTIVGAENGWILIKPNGEQWVFNGSEPECMMSFLAEALEIDEQVKVEQRTPEQPSQSLPPESEGDTTVSAKEFSDHHEGTAQGAITPEPNTQEIIGGTEKLEIVEPTEEERRRGYF